MPAVECQISTSILELSSINISCKFQTAEFLSTLRADVKGIVRACNSFKCMGGILHFQPTAVCHIPTSILELGSIFISCKFKTAEFLSTKGLSERYWPGL